MVGGTDEGGSYAGGGGGLRDGGYLGYLENLCTFCSILL